MTLSYILVFAILIGAVIIWQLRQSKSRYLRLSNQVFPELTLSILISKKERKINKLNVRIDSKKNVTIDRIKFELISPKREFRYVESTKISNSISLPVNLRKGTTFDAVFPYEDFKTAITNEMNVLNSFRVVLDTQNRKVFKSHELKLDKFWKIYKADSGKYN